MAELPGNIHEKIGNLHVERSLTKKQVSEDLGILLPNLPELKMKTSKVSGMNLS